MGQARRKSAEEYDKNDILEWVGAGPKKEGLWKLTEEQLKLFTPHERGIVHYAPGFRYTRWHRTESGYIKWEPATKREFESQQ